MDCSCDRCQNFCHNKPGWFTPQQIESVARKLNVGVEDLFKDYLTIDAVLVAEAGSPTGVYVLAPMIIGTESGSIANPVARGTCVWFKNGRCDIHDVKPAECRAADHSTGPRDSDRLRASILKQWIPYKKLIQNLYGKKLKLPSAVREAYREARKNASTSRRDGSAHDTDVSKRA